MRSWAVLLGSSVASSAVLPCVLAGCLAGCPRPAAPLADAGRDAAAVVSTPDGGFALTPEKLDAWLLYQSVVLVLPPLGRGDGGPGGLRDEVRQRARHDEDFRADAGLSDDDVDRIEELVGAVVAQRNISRITGAEAMREFERAAVELKDAQRAQVDQALGELRARAAPGAALTEERARFGEENVRVLLTREAEVIKTWEALMDARGDKR